MKTKQPQDVSASVPSAPNPNHRKATKRSVFHDKRLCDSCGKEGKKKCATCSVAIFCSRECQKRDWRYFHKPVCDLLRQCGEVPMIDEYLSLMRESPTQIGIAHTENHGRIAFVMERKEWYHPTEADREMVLASTYNLSERGIVEMICNAILRPDFDNDLAGSRRPDSVCIHSKSFQNDQLVLKIAGILTRLRIAVVDLDGERENVWSTHWLCVQQGWLDELHDDVFLANVPPERLFHHEPNGQARKDVDFVVKEIPRLDPNDFPTLEQVMTLPFEDDESTRGLWIACSGHRLFICYHGPDGFTLRFHQQLALQSNRRPYPKDVILCIFHVIYNDIGVRPTGCWVGQPSICSHNDVGLYEAVLDKKVIKGFLTLGAMNSMESQLKDILPKRLVEDVDQIDS